MVALTARAGESLPSLAHQFALAQNMVNISCDDPRAEGNNKLTGANDAWITLGSLMWLLILWSLLLA